MEKVKFKVGGCELAGDLYKPTNATKSPAVAIVGPMTFQKAQAPTDYAKRFAELGFVAIAFDPRYRGESGGEPRDWENPFHKVEDLKAAVGYLQERPDVVSDQVSIFAICQGSSIAVGAAAEISDLRALATVSGQYRDLKGDVQWLTQAGLDARRAQGEAAKEKFLMTGVVDYVKAVDKTDMNVGMPGEFVWAWYQPWADRGLWENKYAVMSDAALLAYESITAASKMTTPWLMVHGENCFLPKAALRHMEAVPVTTNTKLIWDSTPHFAYYDHVPSIDRATREAADWFKTAQREAPEPRFAL